MKDSTSFKVVRDPIWNNIPLDPTAVHILDTAAFQRLRYIRQLGFAHLVYPGATHTRFNHALGVYHLARTALRFLRERGGVPPEVWDGEELIPFAALLHDIGHYAFSHALEELEPGQIPADHEAASAHFFSSPELETALETLGSGAAEKIYGFIRGTRRVPLAGLVRGSLDLDKMEYLKRDARFCGVPYGEVDVDRLLQGLLLLEDPEGGGWEIGVHEKAVASLESLLFAKYQMFRNVYWHHGVRAATALYKRIVEEALRWGLISPNELLGPTDEELLYEIGKRAGGAGRPEARRIAEQWLPALRHRRLPKRVLELSGADAEALSLPVWLGVSGSRRRRVEDALARRLGLQEGEVVVDYPVKGTMFDLDVLVQRRSGRVERVGRAGVPGFMDLPRVAEELYRSAQVLRVFCFQGIESGTAILDALLRVVETEAAGELLEQEGVRGEERSEWG